MKTLREGFTTGSCAAACALASCLWRAEGECPQKVSILLPAGREYTPAIHPLAPYRCAVFKDAGDDPDLTNGSEVWAEVSVAASDGPVAFRAGEGVGIVTLPGLKVPVGEAAINPVPRRMIEEAVRSVYPREAAAVTVGITGGREMAQKTFNPRLGIAGGLSILGTTGIVRPMSEEAMAETIRLEMEQLRALGREEIALVFGSQALVHRIVVHGALLGLGGQRGLCHVHHGEVYAVRVAQVGIVAQRQPLGAVQGQLVAVAQ